MAKRQSHEVQGGEELRGITGQILIFETSPARSSRSGRDAMKEKLSEKKKQQPIHFEKRSFIFPVGLGQQKGRHDQTEGSSRAMAEWGGWGKKPGKRSSHTTCRRRTPKGVRSQERLHQERGKRLAWRRYFNEPFSVDPLRGGLPRKRTTAERLPRGLRS